MPGLLKRLYRLLASYAFAITLLGFLLLLTYFGTTAQVTRSLFEVQREYFESLFVIHEFAGIPVPLPGVKLLLGLLCINLICGGLVRIRKNGATLGIIVAHIGILLMLVAGLVEYALSTKGHMTVGESERAAEYVSYFEWEITLNEDGATREWVIPGERFIHLDDDEVVRFHNPEIPFELAIESVHKNSRVFKETPAEGGPVRFLLRAQPLAQEAEADVAGCTATLRMRDGGAEERFILWGGARIPYVAEVGGKRWVIDLHRRRWPVPFDIDLLDFRKIDHPGTDMVKSFESDVNMTEGGARQMITISMNKPLRHRGYTLFQSSWGPQPAQLPPGSPPPTHYWSVFSVVKNPADAWPLYACYIIAAGLLLHFARKLLLYIRTQVRSRA